MGFVDDCDKTEVDDVVMQISLTVFSVGGVIMIRMVMVVTVMMGTVTMMSVKMVTLTSATPPRSLALS